MFQAKIFCLALVALASHVFAVSSHASGVEVSRGTVIVSQNGPAVSPAPTSGLRPEYIVDSGWVVANQWESGWSDCAANDLTYPLPILELSPQAKGVEIRQELAYRYVGDVACHPQAGAVVGINANAWQAFWIGHDPHQIGGSDWWNASVPIAAPAFDGVSAGNSAYFEALQPGESSHVDNTVRTAELVDGGNCQPGFLTRYIPREKLGADCVIAGVPASRLWFTPTMIDLWTWEWLDESSTWNGTHSPVTSGVQVVQRMRLHVREVR